MDDADITYTPDPPAIAYKYKCDRCGCVYETTAKAPRLTNCRNRKCSGTPQRT